MYERAVNGVLKRSMLLHFAYADFEEQQTKHEKAHSIYKKYLEIEDIDPSLVSCYGRSAASCNLNRPVLLLLLLQNGF